MKISVIGCGNMATVTTVGMYRHNPEIDVIVFDLNKDAADSLAKKLGGWAVDTLEQVIDSDFVMICCKPLHFDDLSSELRTFDLSHKVSVSIMASIPLARIQSQLKTKKVIRLMPSMPMKNDHGIVLHIATPEVEENH